VVRGSDGSTLATPVGIVGYRKGVRFGAHLPVHLARSQCTAPKSISVVWLFESSTVAREPLSESLFHRRPECRTITHQQAFMKLGGFEHDIHFVPSNTETWLECCEFILQLVDSWMIEYRFRG